MKIKSSALALLAVFAVAAPSALAGTSISKSVSLCEAAAKAQDPAPTYVRADSKKTRSSETQAFITLKLRDANDVSSRAVCTVDRETQEVTLSPAE